MKTFVFIITFFLLKSFSGAFRFFEIPNCPFDNWNSCIGSLNLQSGDFVHVSWDAFGLAPSIVFSLSAGAGLDVFVLDSIELQKLQNGNLNVSILNPPSCVKPLNEFPNTLCSSSGFLAPGSLQTPKTWFLVTRMRNDGLLQYNINLLNKPVGPCCDSQCGGNQNVLSANCRVNPPLCGCVPTSSAHSNKSLFTLIKNFVKMMMKFYN